MHLHNNKVGRKLMASTLTTKCSCHGVSGSCSMKTCWKRLPELKEFAQILKQKYERAQQVGFSSAPSDNQPTIKVTVMPDKEGLIIKPISRTERFVNTRFSSSTPIPIAFKYSISMQTPASKGELVFLEESPDYCIANPKQHIEGTSGRECFHEEKCRDLCCGRGWVVINEWVEENCNCSLVLVKLPYRHL